MDDLDLTVRNATYRLFVSLGRAPGPREVSAEAGVAAEQVEPAWRRLHDEHALVLERGGTTLRMLNPFSVVPSAYRVEAGGRSWYANCAWDAFGICAALGSDGRISASCPDCLEPIDLEVRAQRPKPDDYLFHVLVPARAWWADIVYT